MWFRRDLRLGDNAALHHCLKSARRVYAAFVFDRAILDDLLAEGLRSDRRVDFIHRSLRELDEQLRSKGGALIVRHGLAAEQIVRLAEELRVDAVFANHDYEPYAIERDTTVAAALGRAGRRLHTFKDQVIFERDEVLTGAGRPFSVFTPYRNAWLKSLTPFHLQAYGVQQHLAALAPPPVTAELPPLAALGFAPSDLDELKVPVGTSGGRALFDDFKTRIDRYRETRDYPSVRGPSYLSVHLRFGTVSIRELARFAHGLAQASAGAATWLSELIWREFYQQILYHHPQVVTASFKPEYDRIRWERCAGTVRRVVRRPHRLSAGRCSDGAAQPDRLHAQPAADGHGELPDQGPWHRLAPGRALLCTPADRLRSRLKQRRLAVGGIERLRRATVLPHLQPRYPEREIRPARKLHPPLSSTAAQPVGEGDSRAVAAVD